MKKTIGALVAGAVIISTYMCWGSMKKEVTTDSGLTYQILKEAEKGAPSPQKGHMVSVNYTGWLQTAQGEKGKKFDSSADHGRPFRFSVGVGQVIKGWDEAVMDMKQGEKRLVIIPANLGYGSRGAGSSIPPNSILIFEIELLKVN